MSGAKLNRQPGPMNDGALEMLRETGVRRGTAVYTADGEMLGRVLKIHHRLQDIDPELKLYASYLDVSNLAVGSSLYVPVDFVSGFDPATETINLSVPMSAVVGETWDREPSFIAGQKDRIEPLPG